MDTEKAHGRQGNAALDFFRGFLRKPEQVGSIIPSSRFLERRITHQAQLAKARMVVELGPGTGGTTLAILGAMPADARLLAIDLDPEFIRILERFDDPRLIARAGDASHLSAMLDELGLERPDVVISGIPFSTIPRPVGTSILEAIHATLAPGGRFVAYQFRGHVGRLARPIFGEPEVALEVRNAPPMRLYRWQKSA